MASPLGQSDLQAISGSDGLNRDNAELLNILQNVQASK